MAPSWPPAPACLHPSPTPSRLSAYLNLLMETCFPVQSADGGSSLPKASRLARGGSEPPPRDGRPGTGRIRVRKHAGRLRAARPPRGGGSCAPAPGLGSVFSAVRVNEDPRP